MFMLLEGSKIPEKDKRLIMAKVNFGDKTNIYQNTKNSMMKLFAGIIAEEIASYHDPKVYETLYYRGGFQGGRAAGFRPATNNTRLHNPSIRGQSNFRGYGRPPGPRVPLGTARGGGRHPGPQQNNTNPPLNGKPRSCFQCGSGNHFIAACPELNGWPTFYAGMCQSQSEEPNWNGPDGNINDYLYGAYTYGQEDQGKGDQEGYQGPQAGGQDQEGFYQVDTSGQNPFEIESMIGQAAAISLRDTDQSGEAKTYFNTYTCLETSKF